jgi:hypothetical protein
MVQTGTTRYPIIVKPRINGVLVTQTDIKNTYSNAFVNDSSTPLTWTLEYREANQVGVFAVAFDPIVSQDDFIFFLPPDSIYAEDKEWTIAVFYQVGVSERQYCIKPYHLPVKNLHDE